EGQTHLDDIQIYPNPNSGEFVFQILNAETGNLSLKITNVLGQLVYSKQTASGNGDFILPIKLPGQPTGVYHLEVISESGIFTRQIVIR
ncbi:MAG: T9SS type A sorting domain-containing protein, partial [Flavobacteriales bacterium]|nr:T9SS type A sorting domain-containing protein [Flavobacteriales bacterium]